MRFCSHLAATVAGALRRRFHQRSAALVVQGKPSLCFAEKNHPYRGHHTCVPTMVLNLIKIAEIATEKNDISIGH